MPLRPKVVALDVVETVFALESLGGRIRSCGLPDGTLKLFFAQMLRDAFALDASGVFKTFREVAAGSLSVVMSNHGVSPSQQLIDGVLGGFAELTAHSDVEPALARLTAGGARLIALSNGAAQTTQRLFARAGLERYIERVVSIEEVRRWKPNRQVYLYAAREAAVAPGEMALIAAHAWDIHGAQCAGLCGGWVKRQDRYVHPAMAVPDVQGESMLDVANALLALPA